VKGWAASGVFALVTFVAVLPHVGVVLKSLAVPGSWYATVVPRAFTGEHFRQALTAPDSFVSILNSLKYAGLATLINLGVGLLVGYLLVRTKAMGRGLLDALCMLPLAVPGLVMAFGYIAMSTRWPMGKDGPLGSMILGATPNPMPLLVAAYAVRRLPYIVRSAVAGLQQTSGELEEAAINLGASRFTAVRRVIVPLILANLIAGSLLVFAFSMLEVSDSLLLAQRAEDAPITKAIWDFSNRLADGEHVASAMGVWGMALLTITLAGASVMLGKKMGAIFRA
jgi:iron(III) transport system permease protein